MSNLDTVTARRWQFVTYGTLRGGAAGVEYAPMTRLICAAACLSIALNASVPAQSRRGADARNMELVGHNDLNGGGDGGEGLALHLWPDGRRILYLAHEAPERCLSIVDVTRPEAPALLNQLPLSCARSHALQFARTLGQRAHGCQSGCEGRWGSGWHVGARCFESCEGHRSEEPRRSEALLLRYVGAQLSWRAQPLVR